MDRLKQTGRNAEFKKRKRRDIESDTTKTPSVLDFGASKGSGICAVRREVKKMPLVVEDSK